MLSCKEGANETTLVNPLMEQFSRTIGNIYKMQAMYQVLLDEKVRVLED